MPVSCNVGINDIPFVNTWHGKPGVAFPPQRSSAGNGASGLISGSPSSTYSARNASACSRCVAALRHTPYRFGVIADHLPPRPKSPPTRRFYAIPSAPVASRYHRGRGQDDPHENVVAQVEGTGPVLLILGGGRCVCPFASGLHRLLWQQRIFLLGPGGCNSLPTSHPTQLPQLSNMFTGPTSVTSPIGYRLRRAPSLLKHARTRRPPPMSISPRPRLPSWPTSRYYCGSTFLFRSVEIDCWAA